MIVKSAAFAALSLFTLHLPASAWGNGSHQCSGVAAYYDTHYHGRTASGSNYNPNLYTAAHRTLPFGTRLRVIALRPQCRGSGERSRAVHARARARPVARRRQAVADDQTWDHPRYRGGGFAV